MSRLVIDRLYTNVKITYNTKMIHIMVSFSDYQNSIFIDWVPYKHQNRHIHGIMEYTKFCSKKGHYQNWNQWLKISKTSYTKSSANNQKVQRFVAVLEGNLSVKNAPKLSTKYLQDKTCKIKQMQNIALTLRIFLNQQKTF